METITEPQIHELVQYDECERRYTKWLVWDDDVRVMCGTKEAALLAYQKAKSRPSNDQALRSAPTADVERRKDAKI